MQSSCNMLGRVRSANTWRTGSASLVKRAPAVLQRRVATLASPATQTAQKLVSARDKAHVQVFECTQMIEDSVRVQQQFVQAVDEIKEQLTFGKLTEEEERMLRGQLEHAESRVRGFSEEINQLRSKLEVLYADAVKAEEAAAGADSVLASAPAVLNNLSEAKAVASPGTPAPLPKQTSPLAQAFNLVVKLAIVAAVVWFFNCTATGQKLLASVGIKLPKLAQSAALGVAGLLSTMAAPAKHVQRVLFSTAH